MRIGIERIESNRPGGVIWFGKEPPTWRFLVFLAVLGELAEARDLQQWRLGYVHGCPRDYVSHTALVPGLVAFSTVLIQARRRPV